jgi:hypothetical protein
MVQNSVSTRSLVWGCLPIGFRSSRDFPGTSADSQNSKVAFVISLIPLQCRPSRSLPDDTQVLSLAPVPPPTGPGPALSFYSRSSRPRMVEKYLFPQNSVAHTRSWSEGSLAHPGRRRNRFPTQATTSKRASASPPRRCFHSL